MDACRKSMHFCLHFSPSKFKLSAPQGRAETCSRCGVANFICFLAVKMGKSAKVWDKSLNAMSPQYLIHDCQLITATGRRRLRLSNVGTCDVRRTRTSLGDRSFTVVGPRHVCGIIYHFICTILIYHLSSFAGYRKRFLFSWRSRHLVTDFRF